MLQPSAEHSMLLLLQLLALAWRVAVAASPVGVYMYASGCLQVAELGLGCTHLHGSQCLCCGNL